MGKSLATVKTARAVQSQAGKLGGALYDRLHAYGACTDPQVSRAALALRRDIHNNRNRPKEVYGALLPHLDDATSAILRQWFAAAAQELALNQQARAEFAQETSEARRAIAALVQDNDFFACGLQTANRRIYLQSRTYAQAIQSQQGLNKKLRNTEDRLVSFIYKALAKPSPFASFTSIVLRSAPAAAGQPGARRELRLARDLLLWLQAQCIAASPALAEQLPVRLNNTIKAQGDKIELFARGRDGTPGMLGGERFVEFKYSSAFELVQRRCEAGAANVKQLEQEFAGHGLASAPARDYLSALLAAGVLEQDFGIPDQATDFAACAAAVLDQLPQQSGQPFAGLFARLARLERELGATRSASARLPLLTALNGCLVDFAQALGTDAEALQAVRDLYFEDVAAAAPIAAQPPIDAAEGGALARLLPLLMLFDAQLSSRMSLATLFKERYGDNAAVGLLDFYKEYRATPKEELFARLHPARDENIAELVRMRGAVCAQIAQAMPDGTEVDLAPVLGALLDSLPAAFDRRSVSVFVQRVPGQEASLVLNGAGTGHGASLSRFAYLFAGPEGSLAEVLAAELAALPDAASTHDVCAVLGANSNLHPPLLQRELVYPGSCARQRQGAVSLRDLQVVCRDGMLALRRADDGTPVNLQSLNFIHPAAGPALYRFLHLFSTHWVYRDQDLLRALVAAGKTQLPRLRCGPVVLCRQLWQHPAGTILGAVRDIEDEFDAMLALDGWRATAGLPQVLFFRTMAMPPAASELSSLDQVMALRRGRLRKPHMLDFRNPFLVRIFLKQLATLAPEDLVQLQESLPDITAEGGPVHELLIQLDHAD